MPTATRKKLYTAKEYAALPDSVTGPFSELVRGEIVEMAQPGFIHGEIQLSIGMLLKQHCIATGSCRVVVESGVITERDPDTVRGPDVSLYSARRLPMNKVVRVYPDIPADLCVEVRSPEDTIKKLLEKAEEYLRSGVKEVWIADPKAKSVRVITVNQTRVLKNGDTLEGGTLLPGFTCKVADFFK
jgi:Uma2 family endonuclease